MRWLRKLLMQCQMLLRRDRAGEELQDELQFHLDQQIAEKQREFDDVDCVFDAAVSEKKDRIRQLLKWDEIMRKHGVTR